MAQTSEPTLLLGEPDREFHDAVSAVAGRSPWQIFWRRFRRDRWALVGGGIVILMIVLALAAPVFAAITGHGPNELFIDETTTTQGFAPEKAAPSGTFWLGADTTSRDQFVRIMYGARTSLTIAFLATGIELLIGITLGVMAGFYRGTTDSVISRFAEVVLALPVLLLALGLMSACGTTQEGCLGGLIKPGLLLVSVVIGLFTWPYIARIVRGQVLSMREREFVDASRSLGAGNTRIMVRELLPNLMAPIIVYATLIIPTNILFEAALSYLGIGIPPDVPSWGAMLQEGIDDARLAWWLLVFPGLFVLITTLGFNLVGDGLRDALDPRTTAGIS